MLKNIVYNYLKYYYCFELWLMARTIKSSKENEIISDDCDFGIKVTLVTPRPQSKHLLYAPALYIQQLTKGRMIKVVPILLNPIPISAPTLYPNPDLWESTIYLFRYSVLLKFIVSNSGRLDCPLHWSPNVDPENA